MYVSYGPVWLGSPIPGQNVQPSSGVMSPLKFKEAQGTATASQYFDIYVQIPTNAKILSTSIRVDTALTSSNGGASFTAQFVTGTALLVTSSGAFTKNFKSDVFHDAIGSSTSAISNLRITCNGGKLFSAGGKVTAIVYYSAISSMNDV